ncbi:MAG: prohibitin family protein [Saprospiraceae bacterium]|nr:prohibitin family protein [Saprospiraceae bacterium]
MTKTRVFKWTSLWMLIIVFTSCATIRQGEVGVKRTLGKYADKTYTEGLRFYNPFFTSIIKISTQTENLEVGLNIPSKEGLNILSEVSILYRVLPTEAPSILRNIGRSYEQNIILPVFRSSVADVTSRFYAKDMHTGERTTIEKAIRDQMMIYLEGKGLVIDAVLLKSIRLPQSLARAIELKLEAEQDAQRMEFVLQQAEREAEQKRIEAKGIRDAQKIIAEGLSPAILQFKSIEAFMELSKSPNAKIIVSDGNLPMLMEGEIGLPATPSKKSSLRKLSGDN